MNNKKLKTKQKMKATKVCVLFLIISITSVSLIAQQRSNNNSEIRELRSLTIEDWDKDYSGGNWGWQITTNADPRNTTKQENYSPKVSSKRIIRDVKLINGAPSYLSRNSQSTNKRVLAVKFNFAFPGNNIVYMRPPKNDQFIIENNLGYVSESALVQGIKSPNCFSKQSQPSSDFSIAIECVRGVRLPGMVQRLSLWVLSRGYDYVLEGVLRDHRNHEAVIQFDTLEFVGWKLLFAKIPSSLSQPKASTDLNNASLILTRLQIRELPDASSRKVYLFFDDLRALSTIRHHQYDGRDITFDSEDCELLNKENKILAEASGNPENWQKRDCSK